MPIQTLQAGQVYTLPSPPYIGTGIVQGESIAIPTPTNGVKKSVTVGIFFSADPGAYVFQLTGSLDNFAYSQFGANIAGTTIPIVVNIDTPVKFIVINQVSKANAVTATVKVMLT